MSDDENDFRRFLLKKEPTECIACATETSDRQCMQSDSADDTKKNTLIEYAVVVVDAEINHLVRLAYRHSFRSTVFVEKTSAGTENVDTESHASLCAPCALLRKTSTRSLYHTRGYAPTTQKKKQHSNNCRQNHSLVDPKAKASEGASY